MNEFEKAMQEAEQEIREAEKLKAAARRWLANRERSSGTHEDFKKFSAVCVERAQKVLKEHGKWDAIDFDHDSVDLLPRPVVFTWCLNKGGAHSVDTFGLNSDFYKIPVSEKLQALENIAGKWLADNHKLPFFVCTCFCARAALVDHKKIRHAQAVEVSLSDTGLTLDQVVEKEKINSVYILSIVDALHRFEEQVLRFVQPSLELDTTDMRHTHAYIPPFSRAVIEGTAEHHALASCAPTGEVFKGR